MEEGGGGLGTMGWMTEEAGVSRLLERVFWRPRSMNGEIEGGGELGGTMFGTRLFEIWGKLQTLPPSKISDILRFGGRTVISGVPNVGGIDFGRAHGCLGAHGV